MQQLEREVVEKKRRKEEKSSYYLENGDKFNANFRFSEGFHLLQHREEAMKQKEIKEAWGIGEPLIIVWKFRFS